MSKLKYVEALLRDLEIPVDAEEVERVVERVLEGLQLL